MTYLTTDQDDIARYRQYAKESKTEHDRVFWHNAAQRLAGKPTVPSVNYRQGRSDLKLNPNPPKTAYNMIGWSDNDYALLKNPLPIKSEYKYAELKADLIAQAKAKIGEWFYRIYPGLKATVQMRLFVHLLQMGYTVQRRKVSESRRGVHEYKITQE